MHRLGSSLLLSLLVAGSASAVTVAWSTVGGAGNACDPQSGGYAPGCYGAVSYSYSIGTYEVTNAQYVELLNAKATVSDPLGLYNQQMTGISRTGSAGSYAYQLAGGYENAPVNFVSFFDALRFANWLNNGQGSASTETGSYTLLGGTAIPSNGDTVARNAGAAIVLPSENEWYKAAYYNPISGSYFDYPARSDAVMICSAPTATANHANCDDASGIPGGYHGDLLSVGLYTGSASPYGTFDQGGNVWEPNETNYGGGLRGLRGGAFNDGVSGGATGAASSNFVGSDGEYYSYGFRLARVPEPGTGLLMIAGLLGLAGWRSARA